MAEEKIMTEGELTETITGVVKESFSEVKKELDEALAKQAEDFNARLEKAQAEAEVLKAKSGDPDYGKKVLDRLVYAAIRGQGNAQEGMKQAKGLYDKEKNAINKGTIEVFEKMEDYRKTAGSLNVTYLSEGSIFLNETVSPEVYSLMIPNSVTDKIRGLNRVTLTGGFEVLCEKTLPTVYNKEETASINSSSGTFEKKRMEGKEIAGTYPVSNRSIREMSLPAAQLASSMMLRAFNKQRESDFIRGDGTAAAIQGLYTLAANVNAASTTLTIAQLGKDLFEYIVKYIAADDNLTTSDITYITSEREYEWMNHYLNATYETKPAVIGNGMLFGKPVVASNYVPDNLTVANVTNTSEIYGVVGNGLVYGMGPNLVIELIPNAAFLNASGTAVYGASQDTSLVRIVGVHDLLKLNNAAVQVLNKTIYGK